MSNHTSSTTVNINSVRERLNGAKRPLPTREKLDQESWFIKFAESHGLHITNLEKNNIARCSVTDDPRNTDGAYLIDDQNSIAWGWVQKHKGANPIRYWKNPAEVNLSSEQRAVIEEERNRQRKFHQLDKEKRAEVAAQQAQAVWDAGREVLHERTDNHGEYIENKNIIPFNVRRAKVRGRHQAIVPHYDMDALTDLDPYNQDIISFQSISDDTDRKNKFNFPGAPVGIGIVGKETGRLYIAEGWSTACTVHEASGDQAIISFGAGELAKVAKAIHKKFSDKEIVIAGDNDHAKKDNPGLNAAIHAAQAIQCGYVVPQFDEGDEGSDFNDLANLYDMDEVREQLADVQKPKPTGMQWTKASDVKIRKTSWLCYDIFPMGELSLVVGHPDVSKSTLCVEVAATVTRGKRWGFDNRSCPKGNVLFICAEDSPERTIVPRLKAAGADLDRVEIYSSMLEVIDGEPVAVQFNFQKHIGELERKLSQDPEIRLVIVDPVISYILNSDNRSDQEIRKVLQPLVDLANRKNISVIGIMHFNKSNDINAELHRVGGSVAFTALPRSVCAVTRRPVDEDKRIFGVIKCNLASQKRYLSYRMNSEEVPIPGTPDRHTFPKIQWDHDAGR